MEKKFGKNTSIKKYRYSLRNIMFTPLLVIYIVINIFFLSIVSILVPSVIIPGVHVTTLQKGGWELLNSGITQNLNNIYFICLNRGTVVGNEGVICYTGNGGTNWTVQNSGVTANLYDIFYFDFSIILAVGESGTILYTNNTGQNWTIKQTGVASTYFSGQMITDMIGVAVGVNTIFQPFFTRTNDGWNTWESTSFYIENNSVLYEGWLTDVYFLNDTVGFATAVINAPEGGAIVRTTNSGVTWNTVFFYDEELLSIDFSETSIGYAVGGQGAIVQTVDGGETWFALESGINSTLLAVDFPSEAVGTIVGDNGIVLRTKNAGLTWEQQVSGTTNKLFGVRFITEQTGFIVGEHGIILRTMTGGYPDDIIPPVTNCTLTGIRKDDIYISNVSVALSAIDNLSGVAETLFKLDDGIWTTYLEPFLVITDGKHILNYYSIDNAGNYEEEKTCEFIIQLLPNLTITITGGFNIKVIIKNLGTNNLTNISWNLSLNGGLILIGKQKSGIVDIKAGNEVTIKSFTFGLGKPIITFTIASSQKIVLSSIFLFFVHI